MQYDNQQSLNTCKIQLGAPIRVGMVNLGCAKNLVDAEVMLGSVTARGMKVTSDAAEADVLVINTCAFIDAAKEESIDAILQAHQERAEMFRRWRSKPHR